MSQTKLLLYKFTILKPREKIYNVFKEVQMKKYSIIYYKIKTLCELNNITIAKLERKLNFSEGLISKWKSIKPSFGKVISIANHFDVSLDFMAGRTLMHQISDDILADKDMMSIQIAMHHMSINQREKMMAILKLTFPEAFNCQHTH